MQVGVGVGLGVVVPAEGLKGLPLAMRPARTRPMPSRPMNGSDPMFEIWSCSEPTWKGVPPLTAGARGQRLRICSCSEPAVSAAGAGRSRIFLSRGSILSETSLGSSPDCRLIAEVYTIGKSVCSSEAPRKCLGGGEEASRKTVCSSGAPSSTTRSGKCRGSV